MLALEINVAVTREEGMNTPKYRTKQEVSGLNTLVTTTVNLMLSW